MNYLSTALLIFILKKDIRKPLIGFLVVIDIIFVGFVEFKKNNIELNDEVYSVLILPFVIFLLGNKIKKEEK